MNITHVPIKQEILTPKQYLATIQRDRQNIERVEFVPPKIGDGTFGAFQVTYRFMKLNSTRG